MELTSSGRKTLKPQRLLLMSNNCGEIFVSNTELSTTKNYEKITRKTTTKPFDSEDLCNIPQISSTTKKRLEPFRIGQEEFREYFKEELGNNQKKTVKKARKELFTRKKDNVPNCNTVVIKKKAVKQVKCTKNKKPPHSNSSLPKFEVKKNIFLPVPSTSGASPNLSNSSDLEFDNMEKQCKIEDTVYEKVSNILNKQRNKLSNLKHKFCQDIEELESEYMRDQLEILQLLEGTEKENLGSNKNVVFNIKEEENGVDKGKNVGLYSSLRGKYKSILCTPKISDKRKLHTPSSQMRRKQSISNKVHSQCLLLQDTPFKG